MSDGVVALERGTAVSFMCSKTPALPSVATVLSMKKAQTAGSTLCGVGSAQHGATWANWIAAPRPVLTH